MSVNLFFTGTAGSGKSNLTKAFSVWMDRQGYRTVRVNLDPGAEDIPYEVDVDIRDWVSLPEVMDEHGLGPNGAQIVCADMIAVNAREIREVMDGYDCHYYLIDTPGQMELFTFRQSSKEIVRVLGAERSLIAFLFDPILSKQPNGFASLLLLAATTQFRFDVPYYPVLSKADVLSDDEIDMIQRWSTDYWDLESALREKGKTENQIGMELVRGLSNVGLQDEIKPVSSTEETGLADIYSAVQMAFFGGEDLESE